MKVRRGLVEFAGDGDGAEAVPEALKQTGTVPGVLISRTRMGKQGVWSAGAATRPHGSLSNQPLEARPKNSTCCSA